MENYFDWLPNEIIEIIYKDLIQCYYCNRYYQKNKINKSICPICYRKYFLIVYRKL